MAKRPRDPNQLAAMIVGISTGEIEDMVSEKQKNPKGRAGGLVGGNARAKTLSDEQKSKIAHIAAAARWKKSKG